MRRSQIERKIALLQGIQRTPKLAITRILANAGLPEAAKEWLITMVSKGLLVERCNEIPKSKRKRYCLTKEGCDVLALWKNLRERLEPQ